MTTGLGSSSAYAASETDSLSLNGALPQVQQFVGDHAEPMSDQEREAAAFRAGNAMNAWFARFKETRDPVCLDMAHRHMEQMVAIRALEKDVG